MPKGKTKEVSDKIIIFLVIIAIAISLIGTWLVYKETTKVNFQPTVTHVHHEHGPPGQGSSVVGVTIFDPNDIEEGGDNG